MSFEVVSTLQNKPSSSSSDLGRKYFVVVGKGRHRPDGNSGTVNLMQCADCTATRLHNKFMR